MKKIAGFFFLLLISIGWGSAQNVGYYNFSCTAGSYEELGGSATSVTLPAQETNISYYFFGNGDGFEWTANTDSMVKDFIPLGFEFTYHGTVFDKLLIAGQGFLVLGEKNAEGVQLSTKTSVQYMLCNGIGLAGDATSAEVGAGTEIKYLSEGDDGAKTFTVQYTRLFWGSETYEVSYQIQLVQADNSIRMVFGTMNNCGSVWFRIGLRNDDSDCHFRIPNDKNWTETKLTTGPGKSINSPDDFPSGTTYTFTMPEPCQTPADQQGLTIEKEVYSDNIEIFPKTDDQFLSDGVLVILSAKEISEGFSLSTVLSTGQYFDVTDNPLVSVSPSKLQGDTVYVMVAGSKDDLRTSYEYSGLDCNTNYYLYTYAYNFRCSGDPKYGTAVKEDVHTRTAPPASLTITACEETSISLVSEANDLSEDILVLQTDVLGTDQVGNRILIGDFGSPSGDMKVGDTVYKEDGSFGGEVIYVGTAGQSIERKDLESNRIYHFAAFSKSSDGQYSSLFAQADTITNASVPFKETFGTMPTFENPYGWTAEGESDWNVQRPTNGVGSLSLVVPLQSGGNVAENSLTSPRIRFPEAKDVRMNFTYTMTSYKSRFDNTLLPSDWTDADSIVFEASKDGVSFTPFYAINKFNADRFEGGNEIYQKQITIRGYTGEQVQIRTRYVSSFTYQTTMKIYSVELVELPDCDYPIDIKVIDSTIVGDEVRLSWTPGLNEETVWNISYGLVDEDGEVLEWSEPYEIHQNPYLLQGLETARTYQVRVRAQCAVGMVSDWTYSESFVSGYSLPMQEDFSNMELYSAGFSRYPVLASGWMEKPASIREVTDLTGVSDEMGLGQVLIREWKTGGSYTPGVTNGALEYSLSRGYPDWIILPRLRFPDEEGVRTMEFLAATIDATDQTEVTDIPEGARLWVLASYDDGDTYRMEDTLLTMDHTEMSQIGDSAVIKVDLSELSGMVRLAIYMEAASDAETDVNLFIDNIHLYEECAPVQNLKVVKLTDTSARIAWDENEDVGEWIVKLETPSGLKWQNVTETTAEWLDLLPRTDYVASVSYRCGVDTVRWTEVSFTTAGESCDPVSDLACSSVGSTSAVVEWKGSAHSYRVRIGLIENGTVATYTYYTTSSNTYSFNNQLQENSRYSVGVQALCSESPSDTSVYVNTEFKTSDITCFAPTSLQVKEKSYNKVVLGWEGDASAYQVSYKKETEAAWILGNVTEEETAEVASLEAKMSYMFRVRSICSEGDTSTWSDYVTTVTEEIPVCEPPTGLKTDSVTDNSAVLMWDAGETDSYMLRFRSSLGSWDTIRDLDVLRYKLENLEPNTSYLWSVMCLCDEDRISGWATQISFTTLEELAVETVQQFGWKVFASNGQIHILNPSGVYIEKVEIFDRAGRLEKAYSIKSDANILLTTRLENEPVLVRIWTGNGMAEVVKIFVP